jgi:hypothetical protein
MEDRLLFRSLAEEKRVTLVAQPTKKGDSATVAAVLNARADTVRRTATLGDRGPPLHIMYLIYWRPRQGSNLRPAA